MREFSRWAGVGALILGMALVGFIVYEVVLYPAAGFPTEDYGVVVAGVNTLRIGHLLKFGYAAGLVLLLVGLYTPLRVASPIWAQVGAVSGIAAITLLVASGMMGLGILQVAQDTFANDPEQAITTILLRAVTIALFEAAIFASGFFVLSFGIGMLRSSAMPRLLAYVGIVLGILFVADRVLWFPLNLVSASIAILWSFSLAYVMLRRPDVAVRNAVAKV